MVSFDDPHVSVGYGETGRVKLTTLTKEFFVPGFLERDEGEREEPYEPYPWDGVSGVRPFQALHLRQRSVSINLWYTAEDHRQLNWEACWLSWSAAANKPPTGTFDYALGTVKN